MVPAPMPATTTTAPDRGAPPRRREPGVGRAGARLLSLTVLLLAWWLVTALHVWSDILVPSPGAVWHAFVQSVTTHDGQRGIGGYYLWQHLWASFQRIVKGVSWGLAVGAPLGIALATVRPLRIIVEPYVNFLRALPPLGYFGLLIIWFGIDDTSKVWLLFITAFPPIALAVMAGVERVRPEHLESSRSLGASRLQVVLHTVLPSALPDLLTGLRVALGFAWTTIVAAETANGIPGIGGLAWSTKKELRSDVAVLCVVVIGLTALALDRAIQAVEHRFVPWKGRA
jgi:taurine transport system permease protein